jgi:cyclopropane fatty-acyl-phospholipid synthase-like methyltransferase
MVWNKKYTSDKRVWGNEPSELALFASNILQQGIRYQKNLGILDLGCGYGRDAMFLARNLKCYILGIDNSETAIAMAKESIPKELESRIELLPYDFSVVVDKYDVIFVSSLYHLLRPFERTKLRETIRRCLSKQGALFLSTLSVRDPQEFGKGTPVEGDENSFMDEKFHHFSTRSELESDFDFLNISALFERDYRESHSTGETHRHISWILYGNMK